MIHMVERYLASGWKKCYKQNVFKDKLSLAKKVQWFWKVTAGITNKHFLITFTPKIDALYIHNDFWIAEKWKNDG